MAANAHTRGLFFGLLMVKRMVKRTVERMVERIRNAGSQVR